MSVSTKISDLAPFKDFYREVIQEVGRFSLTLVESKRFFKQAISGFPVKIFNKEHKLLVQKVSIPVLAKDALSVTERALGALVLHLVRVLSFFIFYLYQVL